MRNVRCRRCGAVHHAPTPPLALEALNEGHHCVRCGQSDFESDRPVGGTAHTARALTGALGGFIVGGAAAGFDGAVVGGLLGLLIGACA